MSFQRTGVMTTVVFMVGFLFMLTTSSLGVVAQDAPLSAPLDDSWITSIREFVKRQANDPSETGLSEVTPSPLVPLDDAEQTTTTKKPKKKKKNKNKNKKNKKNKKSTPAPMTTILNLMETEEVAILDNKGLMGESLGENITLSAYPEVVYLFEGHNDTIMFNFTNLLGPVIMNFESENEKIFTVVSDASVVFDPEDPSYNGTLVVTLKGRKVDITKLIVHVTDMEGEDVFETPMTYVVKTKRVPRLIDSIFDFLLLPLILITTAGMGCKMDFIIIRDKLKKPFQILVGPVCQFICQPFYAFCISKVLKLSGITAVGLVTVGSCPGGGVSNMITLLLDADLILSVTMTFVSTCLAVAMLPINMLIYARHFLSGSGEGGGVNIPFANIMIQILMLTVPVLFGMLIHYKLPKVAHYAVKSLNVLSLTMVGTTLIVGIYSNLYIFSSEWQVLLGAFLLPTCGYITGFSVSKFIARFPMESALTIMVETGVQNNLIAISMIKLSYPQPEADLMARMPIFVAISSITIGLIMICLSIPINRKRRAERKQKAEEIKELDDRYDKYEFEPAIRNGSTKATTNGHFPTTPISEVPPSYEEAEPFITQQKMAKETIV
ncbi:sodium/bile acid cotransporter 5 [Strongylocentrotus purpuratus]|uniref:Ileal sodium/bile acid cotransporter n=1 Tax=Strongylocentrotus purpuratus TaxID=7668 RepID=A0A7M7PRB5_STRPU|nr:sodium/bile acid cotransporter 5 [Strongylocentrotus purpuratus]